jgi:hypothetical protein
MLQQDDKEYRNRQDTVNPRRADERASSITSKIWAIVGSIVIILIVTICLHPITTTMTTTKTTTATTSAIVKTATSIHHTVPLNLTEMLFREGHDLNVALFLTAQVATRMRNVLASVPKLVPQSGKLVPQNGPWQVIEMEYYKLQTPVALLAFTCKQYRKLLSQ